MAKIKAERKSRRVNQQEEAINKLSMDTGVAVNDFFTKDQATAAMKVMVQLHCLRPVELPLATMDITQLSIAISKLVSKNKVIINAMTNGVRMHPNFATTLCAIILKAYIFGLIAVLETTVPAIEDIVAFLYKSWKVSDKVSSVDMSKAIRVDTTECITYAITPELRHESGKLSDDQASPLINQLLSKLRCTEDGHESEIRLFDKVKKLANLVQSQSKSDAIEADDKLTTIQSQCFTISRQNKIWFGAVAHMRTNGIITVYLIVCDNDSAAEIPKKKYRTLTDFPVLCSELQQKWGTKLPSKDEASKHMLHIFHAPIEHGPTDYYAAIFVMNILFNFNNFVVKCQDQEQDSLGLNWQINVSSASNARREIFTFMSACDVSTPVSRPKVSVKTCVERAIDIARVAAALKKYLHNCTFSNPTDNNESTIRKETTVFEFTLNDIIKGSKTHTGNVTELLQSFSTSTDQPGADGILTQLQTEHQLCVGFAKPIVRNPKSMTKVETQTNDDEIADDDSNITLTQEIIKVIELSSDSDN